MSDSLKKWCTLADSTRIQDELRFQILNEMINEKGLPTEFQFLTVTENNITDILEKVKSENSQIRFAGDVGKWVVPLLERLPSAVLSLKSADALVCEKLEWWARFYLVEGLNQMFATDAGSLDLGGSVLIMGTSMESRAVVAALSKIGFSKMLISDSDDAKTSAFVEEMKKSYFGVRFQAVPRSMITQLPGVCSMAVNTLNTLSDPSTGMDLAYFNFFKAGGYWLDLSIFPLDLVLANEAQYVGATLLSGARVYAITDAIWAEAVFKVKIDTQTYVERLNSGK